MEGKENKPVPCFALSCDADILKPSPQGSTLLEHLAAGSLCRSLARQQSLDPFLFIGYRGDLACCSCGPRIKRQLQHSFFFLLGTLPPFLEGVCGILLSSLFFCTSIATVRSMSLDVSKEARGSLIKPKHYACGMASDCKIFNNRDYSKSE